MSCFSYAMSPFCSSKARVFVAVLATLLVLGCEKSSEVHGPDAPPSEVIGIWESDTSSPAAISFNAEDMQGQPVTITQNGELSVTLELAQNGNLLPTYHFITTDSPCSTDNPCTLTFNKLPAEYRYQFLETGMSPDGVVAYFMRFSREDQSQSGDGFVFVEGNRLCISHVLWGVIDESFQQNTSGADLLAINFDSCFTKQ